MKLTYENNGYKVYDIKILNYKCQAHQTRDCGVIISVPTGKTPEEKAMFDSLVYHNHKEYNAPTIKEARAKVRNFIRNYHELKCQK